MMRQGPAQERLDLPGGERMKRRELLLFFGLAFGYTWGLGLVFALAAAGVVLWAGLDLDAGKTRRPVSL